MGVVTTKNRHHYRRWLNVIPSVLLPGAAHMMAGKKKRGLCWLSGFLLLYVVSVILLLAQDSPFDMELGSVLYMPILLFSLAAAADACRYPIPRTGNRVWAKFIAAYCAFVLLPLLLIRVFVAEPFRIPSHSMEPTILGDRVDAEGNAVSGDCVMAEKITYRFHPPRRGDIVVHTGANPPDGQPNHKRFVARMAGLPGESLRIDPPYLIIDGEKVLDPPFFKIMAAKEDGYPGFQRGGILQDNEVRLGDDEYYVLCDRAFNSKDSRYFGPIMRDGIVGRVTYIFSPAGRKGPVGHGRVAEDD